VTDLARIGDTIRGKQGEAYALAPHPRNEAYWKATVYLLRPTSPPFTCGLHRDKVEDDLAKSGALLAFADPWSTWAGA
jgi:hypothetical protein